MFTVHYWLRQVCVTRTSHTANTCSSVKFGKASWSWTFASNWCISQIVWSIWFTISSDTHIHTVHVAPQQKSKDKSQTGGGGVGTTSSSVWSTGQLIYTYQCTCTITIQYCYYYYFPLLQTPASLRNRSWSRHWLLVRLQPPSCPLTWTLEQQTLPSCSLPRRRGRCCGTRARSGWEPVLVAWPVQAQQYWH